MHPGAGTTTYTERYRVCRTDEEIAVENQPSDEQIVDPGRSSLYEEASLVCTPGTEIPQTPEAVENLLGLHQRLRDAGDCVYYLRGGVLAALLEGDRWRQKRPDLTFGEFCEKE